MGVRESPTHATLHNYVIIGMEDLISIVYCESGNNRSFGSKGMGQNRRRLKPRQLLSTSKTSDKVKEPGGSFRASEEGLSAAPLTPR